MYQGKETSYLLFLYYFNCLIQRLVCLRSTSENIWCPPWGLIKYDPIHVYHWAFRRDEKHEARSAGIRRKRCPRLTATHGGHEGPLRGERRVMTRERAKPRPSRSPSWARAPSRSFDGRNRGLSDRNGGTRANQWGVAQNQWGIMEEPAPTWSTFHQGTVSEFFIKRWPQAILAGNHGWARVTSLYHT